MSAAGYIKRKKNTNLVRIAGGLQNRLGTFVRPYLLRGQLYLRNVTGRHELDRPIRAHGLNELCWTDKDVANWIGDEVRWVYAVQGEDELYRVEVSEFAERTNKA